MQICRRLCSHPAAKACFLLEIVVTLLNWWRTHPFMCWLWFIKASGVTNFFRIRCSVHGRRDSEMFFFLTTPCRAVKIRKKNLIKAKLLHELTRG